MTSNSPIAPDVAIVIVQGSFQTPLVYKGLKDGLTDLGYPTFHPELPSCTNVAEPEYPSTTLSDDSAAVEKVIRHLVEAEGKRVFVVMHSYGGLVGSNAIPEELSIESRKAQHLSGGVIHLFYFAAFALGEGQTVLGTFGESPHEDVQPDGRFSLKDGAKLLYNDLPPTDAEMWASRLIPQSRKVKTTEIKSAAYKYVPSTYLICENDMAVPPQFQEMFAQATGAKDVEKCAAGHSPMLSELDMLVGKIASTVQKATS